jgi:hypothetical protein
MRERTANAAGTKVNEGRQRRITVTMDVSLFNAVRDLAAIEDRSISDYIVRLIKREIIGGGNNSHRI